MVEHPRSPALRSPGKQDPLRRDTKKQGTVQKRHALTGKRATRVSHIAIAMVFLVLLAVPPASAAPGPGGALADIPQGKGTEAVTAQDAVFFDRVRQCSFEMGIFWNGMWELKSGNAIGSYYAFQDTQSLLSRWHGTIIDTPVSPKYMNAKRLYLDYLDAMILCCRYGIRSMAAFLNQDPDFEDMISRFWFYYYLADEIGDSFVEELDSIERQSHYSAPAATQPAVVTTAPTRAPTLRTTQAPVVRTVTATPTRKVTAAPAKTVRPTLTPTPAETGWPTPEPTPETTIRVPPTPTPYVLRYRGNIYGTPGSG